MPKYLVLYRSSVPATEQMGSDPEEAQAGMALWMNWAGRVGNAMADMGSPLQSVGVVTASGSTADVSSPVIGGFSVLEADSVDAAKKLLDDHPHFHAPGNPSIEVLEFLPIPGMQPLEWIGSFRAATVTDGATVPPGLVPLAEGREAQVFLRADGRVVKVMRSVRQEPQVLREAAALQALADRQHLAPAFREVTEVAGRPALVSDAQGDPAADVARTLLLLRMGELPPNMSQSMRALTPIGRGILARRYLAIYRRSTARDLSRLDDWLFVRAAARFNERIDVEYPRLLRLLQERS